MKAGIMRILVFLVAAIFAFSVFAEVHIKNSKSNKTDKKDPNDPEMVKKLQAIMIPKIDLQKVGISEAVKKLNELAMQSDPQKAGVNISMDANDQISGAETPISYTKENVSLETALKEVCKHAGYSYVANTDGVKVSKPGNVKKDKF